MYNLLDSMVSKMADDNSDYLNDILVDLAHGFEKYFQISSGKEKTSFVLHLDNAQYYIAGDAEIDNIVKFLFSLVINEDFFADLKPTVIWVLGKILSPCSIDLLLKYLENIHDKDFDQAIAYQLLVSIDNFIYCDDGSFSRVLNKYDYMSLFDKMAPNSDDRFKDLLQDMKSYMSTRSGL